MPSVTLMAKTPIEDADDQEAELRLPSLPCPPTVYSAPTVSFFRLENSLSRTTKITVGFTAMGQERTSDQVQVSREHSANDPLSNSHWDQLHPGCSPPAA